MTLICITNGCASLRTVGRRYASLARLSVALFVATPYTKVYDSVVSSPRKQLAGRARCAYPCSPIKPSWKKPRDWRHLSRCRVYANFHQENPHRRRRHLGLDDSRIPEPLSRSRQMQHHPGRVGGPGHHRRRRSDGAAAGRLPAPDRRGRGRLPGPLQRQLQAGHQVHRLAQEGPRVLAPVRHHRRGGCRVAGVPPLAGALPRRA